MGAKYATCPSDSRQILGEKCEGANLVGHHFLVIFMMPTFSEVLL